MVDYAYYDNPCSKIWFYIQNNWKIKARTDRGFIAVSASGYFKIIARIKK